MRRSVEFRCNCFLWYLILSILGILFIFHTLDAAIFGLILISTAQACFPLFLMTPLGKFDYLITVKNEDTLLFPFNMILLQSCSIVFDPFGVVLTFLIYDTCVMELDILVLEASLSFWHQWPSKIKLWCACLKFPSATLDQLYVECLLSREIDVVSLFFT